MAYDLLIKDAEILDGTGTPAVHGNLAVQDGKIVALGDISGTATRTIDADGGSPGRACHALGDDTSMGCVGADSVALLERIFA